MERLSIKSDLMFKCVFGRDRQECKEALKRLLSAILGIEIKEIRYKNPFNINEFDGERESEFDIEVETENKVLEIEMQLDNIPSFPERLVYYGAKLLTGTISKGEDYGSLRESVVIAILDFDLFKNKDSYYSEYCFMDKDSQTVLTKILRIITLEMVKLRKDKPVKEMNDTEKWLTYLKYAGDERYESKIKEIVRESEGIQMADTILREVSADERMRSILKSREKFERDTLARMNFARQKGMEVGMEAGMEVGIEKGAEKAVMMLIELGMDKNTVIKKVTSLYGITVENAVRYYESALKSI